MSPNFDRHARWPLYHVVLAALSLSLFFTPMVGSASMANDKPWQPAGANCLYTDIPEDPAALPPASIVALPPIALADSVWGATGRDSRGHIWFGVTTREDIRTSAHLVEYNPETDETISRGSVTEELDRLGLLRENESQAKIHTKILQAADGYLYFASTDLLGADFAAGSRPPTWGSHGWRMDPETCEWEHLFAAPEGLMAAAGTGRFIYFLGIFGHVLYQYDTATGDLKRVEVGALEAHFSRNIFTDLREHVYVPRMRRSSHTGESIVMLVEYDTDMEQVGQNPLGHYLDRTPRDSHGITGFQPMADGSIVFVTHHGFLFRLVPQKGGPAELQEIGWFHPDGRRYVASLFTYAGERYLIGLATGSQDKERGPTGFDWVVYDLKEGGAVVSAFEVRAGGPVPLRRALLYGCVTRDDAGRFYIVGRMSRRHPAALRVACPDGNPTP